MRIAVVDYYGAETLHKDPAQITFGLSDIGVETVFIARNFVSPFDVMHAPFPLITSAAIEDPTFWRDLPLDVVLVISRLAPDADNIVSAINAAGLRMILKADSDGTLGYPLVPNYLRTLSWRVNPVRTFLRHAKWRLPIRRFVRKKIDQIAVADAVIVESPKAQSNILSVLKHWKCEHLGSKVFFVPNPVAPDIFAQDAITTKQKLVLAVGRWEDFGSKNTDFMVRSIIEFLHLRNDYRALIIGSGSEVIHRLLKKYYSDLLGRVRVLEPLNHSILAQRLAEAQILYMPSRMESFGIVAAEALCVGCSIAVTPIESLEYLAADGFSGTVASDFDLTNAKEALLSEAKRWDAGEHSPIEIAGYWRARLDRRTIASTILSIAEASNEAL